MVKKFLIKIVLLILFSGYVFSKDKTSLPPGLKFNKKYLSDKQLNKLESTPVTMNNFEKLAHVFPYNGASSTWWLGRRYEYNNKFFLVETDKTGKQWIHLSMDSKEPVSSHGYLKNYLKLNNYFSFRQELSVNFTFNLYSSSYDSYLQLFSIYMNRPLAQTIFQIYYKNEMLFVQIPVFSKGEYKGRTEIELGNYRQETDAKLKFEIKDKTIYIYFNNELKVSQPITEDYDLVSMGYYSFGLYPGTNLNFFSEMFISDIEITP